MEGILKILDDHVMANDVIYQRDTKEIAKEITQHVFEFIEWLQNDCEYWYEMDRHIWYAAKTDEEFTLEEIYLHWLHNIKSK